MSNPYETVSQIMAERDQLRAELAALKGGQGEAVAYVLFRDGAVCYEADDNIVISNVPGDETDLYKWRPVYTAPPASADAVSVPRNIALRMAADAAQYDHEHAVVNDNVQLWQQPNARLSLTVGDLRTVRALLAQSESKGVKS